MRVEVVLVTPEIALEWLARPALDPRTVDHRITVPKYALAMSEGRWIQPGLDAIGFDTEGRRLNGAHRLFAVVLSGTPILFLVAFDADPALLPVTDKPRPRHAWQFAGGKFRKDRIAIARLLLWYDSGSRSQPSGSALQFDSDVLLAVVGGDCAELIETSARDASLASQLCQVPVSVHGAVLTIARREGVDPDLIENWLYGLRDGLGLGVNDPRRHLMRRMTSTHSKMIRRSSEAVWMLTMRAFNAWINGRPTKALKFEPGDAPPRLEKPPRARLVVDSKVGVA